jgi:hypothetical protein
MAADVTSQLASSDVKEFRKDFTELMRVYFGIKKEYSRMSKDASKYIKEFGKVVLDFNKKYKGLAVNLRKTTEDIRLGIILNEKSVKDVFLNAASRLEGLRTIGASELAAVKVEDTDKFTKELDKVGKKMYISYFEQESGSGTIILEQREDAVELFYGNGIENEKSPEFKLCSYYAVKGGINHIDIHDSLSRMGFIDSPKFSDVMNFFKKFNPKIEE